MLKEHSSLTSTVATISGEEANALVEVTAYMKKYPAGGYGTHIESITKSDVDGVMHRTFKIWRLNSCD
jgi:hypothetical protein